MKTIENKETSLFLTEDVKLKYSDLLFAIINKPIKEGITLKKMKSDLAMIAKLDGAKVDDLIEFDEEQIKEIKELTSEHLWGMRHEEFEKFGDYIDSL